LQRDFETAVARAGRARHFELEAASLRLGESRQQPDIDKGAAARGFGRTECRKDTCAG